MRSFLIAGATALALAGCGYDSGVESGGDSPERTVKRYLTALAEGDGDRACEELTDEGHAELATAVSTHLRVAAMKDCVASAEQLSEAMYPALADELIDPEAGQVRVDGAKASATPPGGPKLLRLVRRDGNWLVDETLRSGWPEMGIPAGPARGRGGAECDPSASPVDCG